MPRRKSEFRTVFCATCYAGPGEMCSDPRVGYHITRKRELWAKERLAQSRPYHQTEKP